MKISGIYQIQSTIKPERIYIGSPLTFKEGGKNIYIGLKKIITTTSNYKIIIINTEKKILYFLYKNKKLLESVNLN